MTTIREAGRRLFERAVLGPGTQRASSSDDQLFRPPDRDGIGPLRGAVIGPLRGAVDEPLPGATLVRGPVVVSGWHTWGDRPALAVAVSSNGKVLGHGPVGSAVRADVALAYGEAAFSRSGWSVVIDLGELASGPVQLDLAVWGDALSPPEALLPIPIALTETTDGGDSDPAPAHLAAAGEPTGLLRGSIDEPLPGAEVTRGPVVLRGWHAYGRHPALAVAVSMNGKVLGHGSVGSLVRTDVALALDEPELSLSGWSVSIDLHDVPDPSVHLDVSVWCDGQSSPALLPPIPLTLVDGALSDKFVGNLDLPEDDQPVRRDVIAVAGWAFTDQAPVSRLEVLVNGRSAGPARLGLQRPDLSPIYPAPHALVSGFECQVDLSTLPQSEREARIDVIAQTSHGLSTVLFERTVTLTAEDELCGQARPYRLGNRRAPDFNAPAVKSLDRLNLVVFTHDLGYGGGQLWLSELLTQAGAGRDFPCTVVSPRVGPLISDLEDLGIELHIGQDFPVHDLEMYEGRLAELGHWLVGRGHNAALVNTFGSFPGADIAQRLDIPVVWAIHESWKPSEIWSVAYPPGYVDDEVRKLGERALRQAKALMFEADATRTQYLDAAGKDCAIVVPYGIDTRAIKDYCATTSRFEARRKLGVSETSRVLLVMGTTEPRKAQTLLAEAFTTIASQYPDALLVFVGDTGSPYAAALNDYIVSAGISHQTLVLPVLKDINQWYRSADVLVCASDVESLPRSVLDAMCFGIPVLATSVFGLPELITDGETGLLFQPRDLTAATEALRRVLDLDPHQLASIALAGQRLLLDGYESSGYATDTVALLKGLIKDPDALPSDLLGANGRHSSEPALPAPRTN